jgi:hypothetical protein
MLADPGSTLQERTQQYQERTIDSMTHGNRNYLNIRHRDNHTQSAHDRAFLRTLIILIGICIVCMIFGKAEGYGQNEPRTKVSAPAKPATPAQPSAAPSPSPTPSPYIPTEAQADKLRIAQLEAITAQQSWNIASQKIPEYATFNDSVNKLAAACRKVEADNKWPSGVVCDLNSNPVVFVQQSTSVTPASSAPVKK